MPARVSCEAPPPLPRKPSCSDQRLAGGSSHQMVSLRQNVRSVNCDVLPRPRFSDLPSSAAMGPRAGETG